MSVQKATDLMPDALPQSSTFTVGRRGSLGGTSIWLCPFVLLAVCFVIQSPWIFFSLQLSDFGFLLAVQQELMVFGHLCDGAAATFLSNVVGGLWLKMTAEHGIAWIGVGGALLNCLNVLCCYAILWPRFGAVRTTIAMALTCAIISAFAPYGYRMVGYYSFPAFLGTFVWLSVHRSARARKPWTKHIWGAAAVLALAAMPFARLPLVAFIGVVVLAALAGWALSKHVVPCGGGIPWLTIILGLVAFSLMIVAAIFAGGFLGAYLRDMTFYFSGSDLNACAPELTLLQLSLKYFNRFAKATVLATAWLGAFFCLTKYARSKLAACVGSVVLMLSVFLVNSDGPTAAMNRFREVLVLAVFIGAFFHLLRNRASYGAWLGVTATIYACTLAYGSMLSMQPAVYGLWFPLPFVVLSLCDTKPSAYHVGGQIDNLQVTVGASLVAIAVLGFMGLRGSTWSAIHSRLVFAQKIPFRSRQLRGIRDVPDRVKCVDALLAEVEKRVRPGDRCLFYNHFGLLYVLTRTRPCFTSPGFYHNRDGVIQAHMELMLREGWLPKLVVLYDRMADPPEETLRDCQYLRKAFTERLGYQLCCEVEGYEFYERADCTSRRLSQFASRQADL